MKYVLQVCLAGSMLIHCAVSAQDSKKMPMTKGVSVQMATASHAVEMRAADEPGAKVVAITSDGKVYAGVTPTEPSALSSLKETTIYVKADSRAPFQNVLAVLDGLRGKSVVLLTASPENAAKQGVVPPYGVKLTVAR